MQGKYTIVLNQYQHQYMTIWLGKGRKENQVDAKTASEVYLLIKMGIAVQYGFVSEEEAIETYKKLIEEEEDEGNGGDEYDEE